MKPLFFFLLILPFLFSCNNIEQSKEENNETLSGGAVTDSLIQAIKKPKFYSLNLKAILVGPYTTLVDENLKPLYEKEIDDIQVVDVLSITDKFYKKAIDALYCEETRFTEIALEGKNVYMAGSNVFLIGEEIETNDTFPFTLHFAQNLERGLLDDEGEITDCEEYKPIVLYDKSANFRSFIPFMNSEDTFPYFQLVSSTMIDETISDISYNGNEILITVTQMLQDGKASYQVVITKDDTDSYVAHYVE